MSKNLGILIPSKGSGKLGPPVPVDFPTPGLGELVLRVEAAAQNPIDAVQADIGFFVASFPTILGVDAAGVVEAVGPDVATFKAGDRIATMTPLVHDPAYGVYQQYCLAKAAGSIILPESYSFDEAATLPVAFLTAGIGLHTLLGVPIPLSEGKLSPVVAQGGGDWLLVWGGSSSCGALAVQLGKAAGFQVVATASKGNWDYVKSLGADALLDYHDADIVDKIQSTASLSLAFNAVGSPAATEACAAALTDGGKVATTLPYDGPVPEGVEVLAVASEAIFEEKHTEELEGLRKLWQALVDAGKLKPTPVQVMPNGLNSIDEGFDLQRQGKISARKLVYHPQETKA